MPSMKIVAGITVITADIFDISHEKGAPYGTPFLFYPCRRAGSGKADGISFMFSAEGWFNVEREASA